MTPKIELMKLEKWWPKGKTVTWKKVEEASVEYRIGSYFSTARGFTVTKFDGEEWEPYTSIPPKYRHALRFMNFKDACYITVLDIDIGEFDLSTDKGNKWAMIRDGMTRNLVFDSTIRKAFFEDIRTQIIVYPSIPLDIPGFRSPAMDTWLVEEYLFQSHDPAVCSTSLKRNEPYREDPLLFGKLSVIHDDFPMFSFADWVKWASSKKIEYFGTVIDEKLADQFKELGIGIQPTEETTQCQGVKQFRDRIQQYLTGLGFQVVCDAGQDKEQGGDDEEDADGDDDDSLALEEETDSDSSSQSSDAPRRSRVSDRREVKLQMGID